MIAQADRALYEALRDVPIIALTASDLTSERDSALQADMDGVISKPLELDALMSALGERWSPNPLLGGDTYDEPTALLARHGLDALDAFARVAPALRAQLGADDFAVLEGAIDALEYDRALEPLHSTVLSPPTRSD